MKSAVFSNFFEVFKTAEKLQGDHKGTEEHFRFNCHAFPPSRESTLLPEDCSQVGSYKNTGVGNSFYCCVRRRFWQRYQLSASNVFFGIVYFVNAA